MKYLLPLLLLGLCLTAAACDATGECGPFADKFRTTDFTSETLRLENSSAPHAEPILAPINHDTLAAGELALRLIAHQERYFSETTTDRAFHFIRAAYACSPPIPTSDEVIRGIRILSDAAFDGTHPSGTNLADLFDVIVLDRPRGVFYQRLALPGFLAMQPNTASELIFILREAPARTGTYRFTIQYMQDGDGLREYAFTTAPIVLK